MTAVSNVTRSLSEFAAAVRAKDLPADTLHETKRLTLDAIGNAIGGIQTEIGNTIRRFIEKSAPRGPVFVIGTEFSTSATAASYANARLADVIDASDTFMSVHHLGAPVVMAALALGAESSVSGTEFLEAVAAGVEIGARVGSAVGALRRASSDPEMPRNFSAARMPVEEIATAVAAAKISGADEKNLCNTIGIAAANAPRHATHWGVSDPLPDQKYQDYGITAQTGVTAALLAEAGVQSHPDTLGGPPGLWRLCGIPRFDFDLLLRGLGTEWFFRHNAYKPWPNCKWTQYPLTAFDQIRSENQLSADEIDRVVVHSHVFGTADYFRNRQPRTMIGCAFNFPHALAMRALDVPPGPWWYSRWALEDPKVIALRERVHVHAEAYTEIKESMMEDGQLRELPTRVTVYARGRDFSAEASFAKGDPFSERTRFSDDQLFEKFLYMGSVKGSGDKDWLARAKQIRSVVFDLDKLPNVRNLTDMLSQSALELSGLPATGRHTERFIPRLE
jgi:2-methylcitrate dehydratase PrpD